MDKLAVSQDQRHTVVCNARVAGVPMAPGKRLIIKHVLIQSVWKMRWWFIVAKLK